MQNNIYHSFVLSCCKKKSGFTGSIAVLPEQIFAYAKRSRRKFFCLVKSFNAVWAKKGLSKPVPPYPGPSGIPSL